MADDGSGSRFQVHARHGSGWRVAGADECPRWNTQQAALDYCGLRRGSVEHKAAWELVTYGGEFVTEDGYKLRVMRNYGRGFVPTLCWSDGDLAFHIGRDGMPQRDDGSPLAGRWVKGEPIL